MADCLTPLTILPRHLAIYNDSGDFNTLYRSQHTCPYLLKHHTTLYSATIEHFLFLLKSAWYHVLSESGSGGAQRIGGE